jgi:hypothetical protein
MTLLLTPPEGAQIYRTSSATIWINSDDIVCVTILPGKKVTAEKAMENLNALPRDQMRPRLCLVDLRQIHSLDKGARKIFSNPSINSTVTAQAIIVHSPISRIIANFFLGLNKLAWPTRLFTSVEEGLAWLKGLPLDDKGQ